MVRGYLKNVAESLIEFLEYKNLRQKDIKKLVFRKTILREKHYSPVFFLSTGRTGTALFTKLLNKSRKVKAFHSPSSLICNAQSELIEQGRIAYEVYKLKGINDETTNILISQIFWAARENLLYKTFLHDRLYIETNNRITFLAPAIRYLIPHARFVHLYRHPGEFIRSGIRRKYYNSDNEHELGRLTPQRGGDYFSDWKHFDDIQKIAWLWYETNKFIEDFLSLIDKNYYFKFNFNNLSLSNVNELMEFLDIHDISPKTIKKLISKPVNVQKRENFPKYQDWNEEDKNKVKKICGGLAQKYGYKL